MPESNAALVERFRDNDQQAFSLLVGRYHALVFGVCMRILGHRQDAEDATQETFSRFARYLDRWDPRRPLEPWLVAIAGNRSRSFLAARRPCRPLTGVAEPETESVGLVHSAEWLREELVLALSELPEPQRLAFRLFHEQSLSYAEIAEQMDCPLGTVKTWVHRARGSLIDRLRRREVIHGEHRR